MEEVAALARAGRVAIAETAAVDTTKFLDTSTANGSTSLQRDIADGKPSELEYWNGAMVVLGREMGASTPTVFMTACFRRNCTQEAR